MTMRWISNRKLTIEERDEYYEGNRVKVLQKVVGSSVQRHFTSLRDQVVPDLDPADEVEWEEEEDLDNFD